MDTNRKIRYNYLQLKAISKVLKLKQLQQIKKAQEYNLDIEYYKDQDLIYILRFIVEEFIKEFYKDII